MTSISRTYPCSITFDTCPESEEALKRMIAVGETTIFLSSGGEPIPIDVAVPMAYGKGRYQIRLKAVHFKHEAKAVETEAEKA